MQLTSEWITYGENGKYTGLLQYPRRAKTPLPTLVVIQEIWGVDAHIEDVAARFAEAGYATFAPDLYAVDGARPEVLARERIDAVKAFLDTLPSTAWHSPDERQKALDRLPSPERESVHETFAKLFSGLNMELYMDQMLETTSFLRSDACAVSSGSIGSVGFCMGGALSALLACRDRELRGAAIFYGASPSADNVTQGTCPIIGFYGGLDPRITDGVTAFADAMKSASRPFDFHVYEGAQHAFFNDTRAGYHSDAARHAFAATLGFFLRHVAQ